VKPVVIIAIAVACSVMAVFGVLIGLEQLATYQAQVAFEEYQRERAKEQQSIVNAYNQEMQRCRDVFINFASASQCVENARKNFEIYKLDDEYSAKLESGISQEALEEPLRSLEKMRKGINLEEFIEVYKKVPRNKEYYLDRYYNEPDYKDWFDKTFPNITIEEAVNYAIDSGSISNKERYNLVLDDCLYNQGTKGDSMKTIKCLCDYGVIDYIHWYDNCS